MINEIFERFTKPFSLKYKEYIEEELDILRYEFCTSNAYNQIISDILHNINSQLFDALVAEFHSFRANTKRFIHIQDLLNNYIEQIEADRYANDFFEQYPILFNKINDELAVKIDFINKIFEHLNNDKQRIYDTFGTEVDKVEEVKINIGDTHDGKSVSIITLSNSKLLYKPRKIGLEKMVTTIINLMAESDYVNPKLINNIVIPLRIEQDNYYWEEYVHSSFFKTSEDIKSFYYIVGLYLGVFYILNISDIHFENILFTRKTPVFIDLEVMNYHASMKALEQYSFNNSVLTTALLPIFDQKLKLNMSGLFSKEQTTEKLSYQVPKYDEEIGIIYETKAASIKPSSPKLDTENKQKEAKRKLIDGFSDCLHYIKNNRSTIKDKLNDFKEIECRILLRHTSVYSSFLQALNTPEYLKSEKKQEELLQILEENYNPDIFGYVTVYEEIEQLKEENIPKFYTLYNSTDLYARNTVLIKNYFNNTMSELIDKRIDNLNFKMIQYQIYFINLSLLSTSRPNELETLHNNYLLSKQENNEKDNLKSNIKNLIALIENNSISDSDNRADYYSLYFNNEKSMQLNTSQFGLYSNSANILLYYVYGVEYKDYKAVNFAKSLYKNLLYKFENLMRIQNIKETINLSVFNGISSALYISYFLYKYTKEEKYLKEAKEIYKSISDMLHYQINTKKISLDFINGIAGIGFLFIKILADSQEFINIDDIELIKKTLITHKYKINDYGLAHGNLGVGLFLIRYADSIYFNDEINSIILKFIESDDINNNKSWCRGYSGKLYVLHQYLKLLQKENLSTKKIYKRISSILKKYNLLKMDSLSLCHGVFGNADILINLLNDKKSYINTQEIQNEISRLYVDDLSKIRWKYFINIPSDSFMTGATGVAYELMRIANNELPSIMLLDFVN